MKARDLFLAEALLAIGSAVLLMLAAASEPNVLLQALAHAPWR